MSAEKKTATGFFLGELVNDILVDGVGSRPLGESFSLDPSFTRRRGSGRGRRRFLRGLPI